MNMRLFFLIALVLSLSLSFTLYLCMYILAIFEGSIIKIKKEPGKHYATGQLAGGGGG